MCRYKTLHFNRCGHSATTLTICARRDFCPPHSRSRGWSGTLYQGDAFCLGCHNTLQLPGLFYNQALLYIKELPRQMPFSYVVHGRFPHSWEDCAERTRLERMPVLVAGLDMRPLEELVSRLSISDSQAAYPRTKVSREEKTRRSKPPSSGPTPWKQAKSSQDHKKSPTTKEPDHPGRKPAQKSQKTSCKTAQLAQKSPTPTKSKSSSRESQKATWQQKKPSHGLTSKLESSLKWDSPRSRPKKHVQFVSGADVQYFLKDLEPRAVLNHSAGMQRGCTIEPVVWG